MVIATATAISPDLEHLITEIARQIQLSATSQAAVREEFRKLATHLTNGALAPFRPYLFAQGSFRIGTTVRPLSQEEFDLDFIVELLNPPPGSSPRTVYELVAGEVDTFSGFQGSVERKDRCIRLSYPGHFHIDVVPAIPSQNSGILIPSKTESGLEWRHTDPEGYVRWFETYSQPSHLRKAYTTVEALPPDESVTSKTALQVGVQLWKRQHQKHTPNEKLRTPSIVLTTIAGLEAAGHVVLGDCVNDIVAAAQSYAETPRDVHHPTAPDELLSEKWNDATIFAQYQATARKMASQWEQVVAAQGKGMAAIAPLLKEMFDESPERSPVTRAIEAMADEDKRTKANGQFVAAASGSLSVVDRTRGDPKSNFHGDA